MLGCGDAVQSQAVAALGEEADLGSPRQRLEEILRRARLVYAEVLEGRFDHLFSQLLGAQKHAVSSQDGPRRSEAPWRPVSLPLLFLDAAASRECCRGPRTDGADALLRAVA